MTEQTQAETPLPTAVGQAARRVVRRLRGFLGKDGAGESGLQAVSELCFINSAADSLVAVALAGTVFFNVQPGQARTKVILYLITTMAPFALLAPVIGPVLDRFHGRRVVLGATMLGRAGVCWALAGHTKGLEIFPLALASLMISRGFGIARAAVTPRVLPPGLTLVRANARVTFVGVLGGAVVAPLGVGLQVVTDVDWVLRAGALLFLVGVVVCTKLPPHVDSAAGERPARGVTKATFAFSLKPQLGSLPVALRALMPMRAFVGFLTLYLAFQLRGSAHSSDKSGIALLGVAAVVGQSVGLFVGNRAGRRRPEALITVALILSTAACVLGSAAYGKTTSLIVAGVAVLCASLGKLNLDAIIQRDIAEDVRTSAFARSETALQLAWVAGGALGLIPGLGGTLALAVAALGLVVATVVELGGIRLAQRTAPAHPGPPTPAPTVVQTPTQMTIADYGEFPGGG